jgi:murein DD-endopeptidase MepM/ murein hydrolase activator NlpD
VIGNLQGVDPMRWAVVALMLAAAVGPAFAECDVPPAEGGLALSRPAGGSIAREFGDTWDDLKGAKTFHPGLDFEAPAGEPVYAAHPGRVSEAKHDGVLGHNVVIDHGAGVQTVYGHLQRASVSPGACVKAGEEIGSAGSSGLVPAPRLYFELRRAGKPVDPAPLLQ